MEVKLSDEERLAQMVRGKFDMIAKAIVNAKNGWKTNLLNADEDVLVATVRQTFERRIESIILAGLGFRHGFNNTLEINPFDKETVWQDVKTEVYKIMSGALKEYTAQLVENTMKSPQMQRALKNSEQRFIDAFTHRLEQAAYEQGCQLADNMGRKLNVMISEVLKNEMENYLTNFQGLEDLGKD